MELQTEDLNEIQLMSIADECGGLLRHRRFADVVDKFGYAVAMGRQKDAAIEEDLQIALQLLNASTLSLSGASQCNVEFCTVNDSEVIAVIEQRIPTDTGKYVLVEYVVSGDDDHKYMTLEQVSEVA